MLALRCDIRERAAKGSEIREVRKTNASPVEFVNQGADGDILHVRKLVFEESLEHFGIDDIDTWAATGTLLHYLLDRFLWESCGPILMTVLPAGIAANVRAEGPFFIYIDAVIHQAKTYLGFLRISQGRNSQSVTEICRVLQPWIELIQLSEGAHQDATVFHNRGLHYQSTGEFEQAEKAHIESIQLCVKQNEGVPTMYRYYLMLAIARQGRLDDAFALREAHRAEILEQEGELGTLEEYLEDDVQGRQFYDEACTLAASGRLVRGGEWWKANETALISTQLRYGIIDIPPPAATEIGPRMGKGSIVNAFKKLQLK